MSRTAWLVAGWTLAVGVLAALPAGAEARLVVGSKAFTESRILAEVAAQLIEAHSELVVERRDNLGGTMIVHNALVSGDIDLYPEYTGTAWSAVLHRQDSAAPLTTYATVAREYRQRFSVTWLSPLGFNNTYAIAVHKDVAAKHNLRAVSDLAGHLDTMRFGVSHEFLQRSDGWPGLAQAYGFDKSAAPRGMEHGLAYDAVKNGRVNLIDTYSTDGKIPRYPIRLLDDDKGFFPPYDGAFVVRQTALQKHPQLRPVLERLAGRIDDDTMQSLNASVDVDGLTYAAVARTFLEQERLLGGTPTPAPSMTARSIKASDIAPRLLEHLWLTLIALLCATFVGVPLGLLLTRRRRLAGPVIGATGIIQTIPSLALLAFMIPIPGLGLGSRSAILALFLYALLPIVRNTFTGITEVDPDLVDAARGMGLTDRQRLRLVELPLASATIMAGIRTSAVIGIGVATLAAFVGAGGLGDPIITGLQLNDTAMVLSGALPAAGLAIIVDVTLGVIERRLRPRA